ncbi:MAG: type III polyketide synthase [Caulobacteraceae bacterium]
MKSGADVTTAYLNRIGTAVPPNDVHAAFIAFAARSLGSERHRPLIHRMAARAQIEHRWSFLSPNPDPEDGEKIDADGFYRRSAFPSTARRMEAYEATAPSLAAAAVEALHLGDEASAVTHVIVTSCTGLSAPGLDLLLVERFGLNPSVERTVIGFMGCYAAMNALKLGRHIVRSEPAARVLIVCLELCTLHMQESPDLEQLLSFMVFADGCAAALVSAEPTGLALDSFHALLAPHAAEQITWNIRDQGFDMVLSGQVPASVGEALTTGSAAILGDIAVGDIDLWAVHPGGRSVLDAVEGALNLPADALAVSREVLRQYGNMSSATILFVLAAMLEQGRPGQRGCAMAFGPGLTAETMLFTVAAP